MNDLRTYDKYRPEIHTGDCILWAAQTMLGKAIRFVTKADVNHAAIVVRLDEYQGMQDRIFVLEALGPGMMLNLLSRDLLNYKGRAYWCHLIPALDPLRPLIAGCALEDVGKPYDVKGMLGNLFHRASLGDKTMFCSEYWFEEIWKAAFQYQNTAIKDLIGNASATTGGKAPVPGDIEKMGLTLPRVQIL